MKLSKILAAVLLAFSISPVVAGSMTLLGAGPGANNAAPVAATFDPVNSSGGVHLSNNFLTATGTVAGFTSAIGITNIYSSSGKLYNEFTAGTISAVSDAVGILNSSQAVTAAFPGSSLNSIGYIRDGRVMINGSVITTIATWTTGNVVSMAVDFVNNKIWFRVGSGGWNNDIIGNQNPATNTGGVSLSTLNAGPFVPVACLDAVGDSLTANLGASAYAQSVPSGFSNWISLNQLNPPYIGQVATRSVYPNTGVLTGGTNFNSRSRHKASINMNSFQILLPNWFVDGNTTPFGINGNFAENSLGLTATVTASIEFPAGTFTQVKFSGSSSGTISAGSSLLSDAISTLTISAGSFFYVRVFWTTSGGVIAFGSTSQNNFGSDTGQGEAWANGNSLSDLTMSGTVTDTNGGQFGYRPTAIIGTTTKPSVLLLGDSRISGIQDTPDATGDLGEAARTIGNVFAYANGGIPADRADKFVASHTNRVAIGQYFTHIYDQYGINDLDLDAQTAAQVLTSNQAIGGYFAGKPFFLQTVSPHANPGNTAPLSGPNNTQRVSYNTTLRGGGISGVTSVFDVASITESSLNSGLWTATYSTDFLHASATGTAAIKTSAIINTALIHR
jgi:hypothetical protein